jgi:hypothetical protein
MSNVFDPEKVKKYYISSSEWPQIQCSNVVKASDYEALLALYLRRVEVTDDIIKTEIDKVVRVVIESFIGKTEYERLTAEMNAAVSKDDIDNMKRGWSEKDHDLMREVQAGLNESAQKIQPISNKK